MVATAVLAGAALGGCGSDASAGSSSSPAGANTTSGTITRPAVEQAPQVSGSPSTTVTTGQPYAFQPKASGSSGATLSFTIANKPSWATFNSTTGKLSGTPAAADVGAYKGIELAVTDGNAVTPLPAFTITVAAAPVPSVSSNVSLSWMPPTENNDGTQLSNLKGYKVHYGTKSETYSTVINVANPGLTTYVVQNLDAGTYYFSVTAYNSAGTESTFSGEVAAKVN